MRRYTKKELDTYWVARCPECGWLGLTCDCGGFEPNADAGDCSDGTCPRCDEIIEPAEDVSLYSYPKWVWRRLTLWAPRHRIEREASELGYCIHHGYKPQPPTSLREWWVLRKAKQLCARA